ncbi:MAG: zf-HC2 domain-containing protein [Candidatus Aminicenantes bacterium]|nr:zf-HC2 domain-containing protein [Candidatus Aminicenantes bacterium]
MKHLEDEDIARMIDGTISKRERERFLVHLSGCNSCLSVYSESLKFIEEENKNRVMLKLPRVGAVIDGWRRQARTFFVGNRLMPVYAVLLIVVVLLPFLLKENAQVHYIEECVTEMEVRGIHRFSDSNDPMYASVRAGIFVEEISVLIDYGGKEDLRGKLAARLFNELKVLFNDEAVSLLPDPGHLEEESFDVVVRSMGTMLEKRRLSGLFQFGRFVERGILVSVDGKRPLVEEVERYRRLVAGEYNDKLPPGVLKELNKFGAVTGINESKEILTGIKDIFLAAE